MIDLVTPLLDYARARWPAWTWRDDDGSVRGDAPVWTSPLVGPITHYVSIVPPDTTGGYGHATRSFGGELLHVTVDTPVRCLWALHALVAVVEAERAGGPAEVALLDALSVGGRWVDDGGGEDG